MGMHVCALADIHLVLVLDQSSEYLEEGRQIEQLRADIQVLIVIQCPMISLPIVAHPLHIVILDPRRKLLIFDIRITLRPSPRAIPILNIKIDNLIIIRDLILRDDLHNNILILGDPLVIEDDNIAEEIEKFALMVRGAEIELVC